MKRILCVSTGMSPGGAERQLSGLAVMLKCKKYDVEVAWYYDSDFYQPYLENNNVACKHLYSKKYIGQIYKIYREIKLYKPDVVIAYLEGPTLICSLIRAMGVKFRLIVSERNTVQKLTIRRKIRYHLYKYADYIVPNSETQTKFLKNHYPMLWEKITTITNFTDTLHFKPVHRNKSHREKIKILVVGRVNNQKNVKRFIEAVHIAHDKGVEFSVDWYGNPLSGPFYNECLNLIKSYSLDNIISFCPATHDILIAYQNADVFCLPSIYEGYPNVVCEAMSCGLPIICGDICDNACIVEEGKNGFLFNPFDTTSIADSITKICTLSETERKEMGISSRILAELKFSIEVFVEKYLKIIN